MKSSALALAAVAFVAHSSFAAIWLGLHVFFSHVNEPGVSVSYGNGDLRLPVPYVDLYVNGLG